MQILRKNQAEIFQFASHPKITVTSPVTLYLPDEKLPRISWEKAESLINDGGLWKKRLGHSPAKYRKYKSNLSGKSPSGEVNLSWVQLFSASFQLFLSQFSGAGPKIEADEAVRR